MLLDDALGFDRANAFYTGVVVGSVSHQGLHKNLPVSSGFTYSQRSAHFTGVQHFTGDRHHVLVN